MPKAETTLTVKVLPDPSELNAWADQLPDELLDRLADKVAERLTQRARLKAGRLPDADEKVGGYPGSGDAKTMGLPPKTPSGSPPPRP